MSKICDLFEALGMNSCKVNELAGRIIEYAKTGEGRFPEEIKSIRYERTDLTLRTGFFDKFTVEIEGMEGERQINWQSDVTQKLMTRDVPENVMEALQACEEARNRWQGPGQGFRPAA